MTDLKCPGIGRIKPDGTEFAERVLDLHFNRKPTDDEMRAIHEAVKRALADGLQPPERNTCMGMA